jgi:hypothetical protein
MRAMLAPDPHDERITCDEAFPLLGFRSQQAFNHARRRLERDKHRDTGMVMPIPNFRRLTPDLPPDQRQWREEEFWRHHIRVVPEWGGIKWPSAAWSYSRRRCEAIRDRGPDALT